MVKNGCFKLLCALLYMYICVYANTCVATSDGTTQKFSYGMASVDIHQFGDIFISQTTRSTLQCSVMCSEFDTCKAFTYSLADSTCNMNRVMAANSEMLRCDGCATKGLVKYAYKTEEAASSTLGKACHNTADCIQAELVCQQNVCACAAGHVLDSGGSACTSVVQSSDSSEDN